jgi:hypothetical protein
MGTSMAGVGGVGTFDGVVLSGLVATLLVPGALGESEEGKEKAIPPGIPFLYIERFYFK